MPPVPYAGNPTGAQSPSPAPAIGGSPIVNIPVSGDRGADLWAQPFKTLADYLAFLAAQTYVQPYGVLLRLTPLTSGTSLASIAGCRRARVRMVGGGGGGGGCFAFAGTVAGGGGGAGGYAEFYTSTVPVNWTYSIGAGGSGGSGSSSPTAGGNGGSTTFSDGVTTVTAFGGGGGGTTGQPGAAPSVSTNGTINGSGEPGGTSLDYFSGFGGTSNLGGAGGKAAGGNVSSTSYSASSGLAGTGPGAGGSGGVANPNAGVLGAPGGAGAAGMILLEEWS